MCARETLTEFTFFILSYWYFDRLGTQNINNLYFPRLPESLNDPIDVGNLLITLYIHICELVDLKLIWYCEGKVFILPLLRAIQFEGRS